MPHCPLILFVSLLFAGLVPGPSTALPAPTRSAVFESSHGTEIEDLSLEDALQELRRRGLSIVFSSELIRPEMRVETRPLEKRPRGQLREILAPHDLEAIEGAGGALLVVRSSGSTVASGGMSGIVRSRHDRRALSGARIELQELGLDRGVGDQSGSRETITDDAGRFEVTDLAPGAYRLVALSPGFIPQRKGEILVAPNRSTELEIELELVPFMHEEIVVGASRVGLLADEPSSPLSLSRKEVEALPHLGGDVFRALSFLPGAVSNDNTAQFSVHGGRRDELQIMLDGQELYDAFHLKDFDNGLSVVASDTLEGISQSTGAFGAWHGDRMSGVLDLTTQSPSHRFSSFELSVLTLQFSTGGEANENASWMVNARRGSIDLANRIFGKEDPTFWDLFGKLDLDTGQRHRFAVRGLRNDDRLSFSESIEQKRFETEYDSSYLWSSHDVVIGRRQLAQTTLSYSNVGRDRRGSEADEDKPFVVMDRRDLDVYGLRHSFSLQLTPRHSLGLGAEARRYEVDYRYASNAAPALLPPTPWFEPRSPSKDFLGTFDGDHRSAWISDRLAVSEDWTFELGVRYDHHTLTDDSIVSPRANVAWRLDKRSQVHLGWGHFFQSQRPYELGVEDGETSFLRAEKAEHWVLGFDHRFSARRQKFLSALRLEAYRRRIDDPRDRFENLYEPINTFPEIEPDRIRIDPEMGSAEGVELLLRGFAGANMDWWLSYALSRAEDRIAGDWIPRRQDQPHALNLALSRRFSRNWQLDLAWRYHTGWPTTAIALVEGPEESELALGRLNQERLDDYHRLDLRLSKVILLRRSQLRLYLDVQNVYNRKNEAGFDLQIDLEEGELDPLPERWVGTFPSLGVAWRW